MMRRLKALMRAFRRRDEGVTMVEYALLSLLVAMVIAIAAIKLGQAISGTLGQASNCVNSPTNCSTTSNTGTTGGNGNGNGNRQQQRLRQPHRRLQQRQRRLQQRQRRQPVAQ